MIEFEADRPLRVVVFFSGGASGFRYLREHDPGYGDAYQIVGGFTDDPDAAGIEAFRAADVPVVVRDVRAFYDERDADLGDLGIRETFDEGTADRIAEFEPDLVLLSGYMWILTDPVVEAYPVVNVHPADLTITEDDERVYVGADPVFDAIADGREATRSSVHLVTTEVDAGPLLVLSKPFPVHRELVDSLQAFERETALRAYADAHQEWMKWEGDGPALAKALALLSAGRIGFDGATLTVDDEPGPYELGRESDANDET